MTHPQYSQTTLEALSTKELKTIASQIGAIPDGDKRIKQTWVAAIIDHQKKFSPAKVAAMSAHIETVMNRLEPVTTEVKAIDSYVPTPRTRADDESFATAMGLTYDDVFGERHEETTPDKQPNPQLPSPNSTQLYASIVALVAILAFSAGFLVIKMGLSTTAWVIAVLPPLALGLWRYLLPDSKSGESVAKV
jgi:hypothetical protein